MPKKKARPATLARAIHGEQDFAFLNPTSGLWPLFVHDDDINILSRCIVAAWRSRDDVSASSLTRRHDTTATGGRIQSDVNIMWETKNGAHLAPSNSSAYLVVIKTSQSKPSTGCYLPTNKPPTRYEDSHTFFHLYIHLSCLEWVVVVPVHSISTSLVVNIRQDATTSGEYHSKCFHVWEEHQSQERCFIFPCRKSTCKNW